MASNIFTIGSLRPWVPCVQSVRSVSAKINIKKPVPPHFKKSVMLKVTQPFYPKPPTPVISVCSKTTEEQRNTIEIDNPYERILAKELMNWVENSEFIAIFQDLQMTGEERYNAFAVMKRKGIHSQRIGKQVAKRAFEGTKYEVLLPLLVLHNSIAFAETAEHIKVLMKLRKKMRHQVLIAGIVENRFMTVGQLERYAALPDLTTARVQLTSLLSGYASPASRLVQQLNTHQQNLVSNLDARTDQLKGGD